LIPTLNGSGDGVQEDGVVEGPRMVPATSDFISQTLAVIFIEFFFILEARRILSNDCALP
jgi:hypothetical protein